MFALRITELISRVEKIWFKLFPELIKFDFYPVKHVGKREKKKYGLERLSF